MVADIRIKTSLRGHPKRAKLEMLIGPGATGHLLDLWISASMTHQDGILRGLDDLDIAIMANWPGKPQDFTAALLAVRFLVRHPDGSLALHDWAEHQAWVVGHSGRVEQARMAARKRWPDRHDEPRENAEKDRKRPVLGPPVGLKMPEVGSKTGDIMPGACGQHAGSMPGAMPGACGQHAGGNAPLLSSSSTLQKGVKTPPETPNGVSPPVGGAPQVVKRFAPPTVEEIAAYCALRANGLDAEHIHAHYTANGWKVGRNPMKDWKAAVRTWEATSRHDQRAQASTRDQSPAARLLAKGTGGES